LDNKKTKQRSNTKYTKQEPNNVIEIDDNKKVNMDKKEKVNDQIELIRVT
jgi:hypothetical protein